MKKLRLAGFHESHWGRSVERMVEDASGAGHEITSRRCICLISLTGRMVRFAWRSQDGHALLSVEVRLEASRTFTGSMAAEYAAEGGIELEGLPRLRQQVDGSADARLERRALRAKARKDRHLRSA